MPKLNLGKVLEGTAYGVLNEILAEFRSDDGYALPSRYEVVLLPPQGSNGRPKGALSNIFAKVMQENTGEGTTRKTGLQCESIEFPGRNLDTTPDVNIYGPERNIVSGLSYADITGVFQCSTDLREKIFFETWQRLAYDNQAWNLEYYDTYTGSLDIFQLDENNRKRYGVQLIECFPKTIASQSLSYAPSTEIQKISVTFSYIFWKNLTDESDLPKGLPERIAEVVVNGVEREIRNSIPRVINKLF